MLTELKSLKLYIYNLKIKFSHLLDMTVINALLVWKRVNGNPVSLLKFKLILGDLLCRYQKNISRKRGRPSLQIGKRFRTKVQTPPTAFCKDGIAHWSVFNDSRYLCKSRKCGEILIYTQCEKGNVTLCFNKERNCFRSFLVSNTFIISCTYLK